MSWNQHQMTQPLSVVVIAFFAVTGAVPIRASPPHVANREKLAASLVQTEIAWKQILDPAISGSLPTEAEARYAAATTDTIEEIKASEKELNVEFGWNWQRPRTSHILAGDFVLELAPANRQRHVETWRVRPDRDNSPSPQQPCGADQLACGHRGARVGRPRGVSSPFPEEPGLPPRGYQLPITVILDFSSPDGREGVSAHHHR